jgi:hypothetical protein
MSLYAVLAVHFFKPIYKEECQMWRETNSCDKEWCGATPRGGCFGEEYYGNFFSALYTLFQMLTGDSWSEMGVRPVLSYFDDSPISKFGAGMFFVSFQVINSIVFMNLIVAVLLDGMQATQQKEQESQSGGPNQDLIDVRDELLAKMSHFSQRQEEVRTQLTCVLAALRNTSYECPSSHTASNLQAKS